MRVHKYFNHFRIAIGYREAFLICVALIAIWILAMCAHGPEMGFDEKKCVEEQMRNMNTCGAGATHDSCMRSNYMLARQVCDQYDGAKK